MKQKKRKVGRPREWKVKRKRLSLGLVPISLHARIKTYVKELCEPLKEPRKEAANE